MHSEEKQAFYESSVRFDADRIRAAAVYCSDGRFGEQFDELMHHALKLPRYDRLSVPGGAACLATHFETYREEQGVANQLRFLVEVHGLQRVVLIAHEDCAFYTQRLHISPLRLKSQQLEDMKKAVQRVRSIGPNLLVDAFFARKNQNGAVQFESTTHDHRLAGSTEIAAPIPAPADERPFDAIPAGSERFARPVAT